MAPEQAQGGEPDPRTDLFALGVMVYEMLTGKQPFDGSSMEIVLANMTMDPPRMAARANVEVDPALEAFARKLMSRDLRDRYYSAHEAMQALAAIEQGRPRLANGTGAPASIARPTIPTGERPLARTIARLRKRAEEERAATVALAAQPPRGRQAIWAGIVLAIGALIGWHLARQPRVEAAFHATPKVVTTDEALR
jgi:serine/threonine-protein kinase